MADWKFLDWRNRQDSSLEQADLQDPDCETGPVLFPDNETPVEIVFRASLAEFTRMLSALEKGAQLSYPDQWHNVWWSFVKNWECKVDICEQVAECITDGNEALIQALAEAIANNPVLREAIADATEENGGGTPGVPLSDSSAAADRLPDNVRDEEGDCVENALWGACLYLVQSANRAITDFFELTEAASNTLETSGIVASAIPAAGQYASAAVEFADQIAENLQEGYAGAYTEGYEEQLACAFFCSARENCELSIDTIIDILNERLPSPEDVSNFGLVMARIGTGTYTGPEIADAAMYIYFTALRFGQKFADQLGIRPLTDLMSLGADQLASDNWTVLCDCPESWEYTATLTELEFWDNYAFADGGIWSAGNGWGSNPAVTFRGMAIFGIATTLPFECLSVAVKITDPMTGDTKEVFAGSLDLSVTAAASMGTALELEFPVNLTIDGIAIGYFPDSSIPGSASNFPGYTYEVKVTGFGYQPPELGG